MHKMLWETFEKERTEEQESIIFIKISDPRQPQYQKGTKSNHEGVSASPNSDCLLPSLLLPTHKGISATCKYIKPNLFSQFIFLQTKGSKKGIRFPFNKMGLTWPLKGKFFWCPFRDRLHF